MQNPGENTVDYDVPDDVSQKVMYLHQLYFSVLIIVSASFYNNISSGFNWKVWGTSQPIMSMVLSVLERPYFYCSRNLLIERRENFMLFSKTCMTVLWLFCIFSYLLFNIVPTFVDIGVAIVYFIIAFNGWFGLLVFLTMFLYIGKTD